MKKFLQYLNLLFSFFLIINIFQLHFNTTYSINQKKEKRQIEICCTWGHKLADGILTYKIYNAKPDTRKLVISALNYWEGNIEGIHFKQASDTEQVDIKISFRIDNGKVAGQTITNFDSNGFIFDTHILLAEKAFGKQLNKNMIEYIAKHEIGHVFGLGHANFKESIMSALVYDSNNEISDCERKAILEANKWKLLNNNSSSTKSKIKNYVC